MKNKIAEIKEETMEERGSVSLTAAEIEKTIIGKTIRGDWGNTRKYACYLDPNGSAEGENDLGTHSLGKWYIDKRNNTFSVEWESYWVNWSGRVYNDEERIVLVDEQTNELRTSIHTIEEGRRALKP